MLDVRELIDLEHGTVNPRIFSDPEIYKLEQERLFSRSWLFLAHESQLRKPGDFFNTWMGGDPVIVARQKDGTVRAYLNACRHRGMKVCRADSGNAKAFTCTYHGWAYGLDGSLVSLPNLEDAYHNEVDPKDWGLVQVAQIDSYKGLIFGNFDPTAPPLLQYLGDATFYLDCLVDRREGGVEVLPGVHKWSFQGNWKLAAEQFAGDAYHGAMSHGSAFMALAPEDAMVDGVTAGFSAVTGRQFSSPWGHGSGFVFDPTGISLGAAGSEILKKYHLETMDELVQRLGRPRLEGPVGGHNNIFPNLSFLPRPFNTLRVWHPTGPNSFETWALTVVDVNAPDEVKEEQRLVTLRTFSGSGIFEQDDGENWGQIGENLTRGGAMIHRMPLNYQMGLGHEQAEDEDFPGTILPDPIGEAPQRMFYKRWAEFLTSEEWPMPDESSKEFARAD